MNNPEKKTTFLQKMMRRTGGWYLLIVVLITQFFSGFGAIAANYSIQVNAEFSPGELTALARFIGAGLLVVNLLALGIIYVSHGSVREKLNRWQKEREYSQRKDDLLVWNQLTSLAWRYSLFIFIAGIFITILPAVFFQVTVLKITLDQIIYTLLGSFAALLGSSTLSLLLLDHFLKPAYEVLYPQEASDELQIRTRGISISIKLQAVILAIILTSILLVAPIGYHQTAKALETGDPSVLGAMQAQSLVVAFLTILFGALLSALFARSVSAPLQELVQTFNKIEGGDLKQRASITTPDETGELTVYFNRMVSRLDELQDGLESQIAMRTEQLEATSEVGRAISSILDPDILINEVANLITERLGYYYAAIFLISPDGRWAELKSATGEAGKELQAKKHRLSIAGKSMVGSAINLREARIAHDVGLEAVRFDNPLLPDTRSEIALPLVVGGNVLGALDAQSTEANAFDENVTETLEAMANQVAIALQNAHTFQKSQQALKEIRASQKMQLSKAWTDTLDSQGDLEFLLGEKSQLGDAALNVPLALRDQIIGEITLDSGSDWSAEDQDWVESVATQAALALENARLLEESQQVALQERLVAEITSKIWSSNTTDGILKIALKELGSALGASEAIIELAIPEDFEEDSSNDMENKSHGA
ncbi:MAG: GAF domain-containing protein [Anaerolineae bacterium]|jgi:GAF domain-containing protein/HAMP domain-containing protein|nr:GAF domain-containing protein [Anaerolineae bacterium]MBT3712317.1 GAF domain-containing protein [Anaerolineae bacterium]MBT4311472.1 GAF domain-containing protein [Anaerolineae bacterium]MBT4458652.1 GAF domain-containing protein [Anaerolineae bacterium]MBT6062976.1 GAF domain-containing protein [Anaerolineae bacterium]